MGRDEDRLGHGRCSSRGQPGTAPGGSNFPSARTAAFMPFTLSSCFPFLPGYVALSFSGSHPLPSPQAWPSHLNWCPSPEPRLQKWLGGWQEVVLPKALGKLAGGELLAPSESLCRCYGLLLPAPSLPRHRFCHCVLSSGTATVVLFDVIFD